jgi:hypothetical protein
VSATRSISFGEVRDRRELFWHNVVREFLTNLAILSAKQSALAAPPEDNPFDGRLAIITSQGVRISIGAISPMFACGINGTQADRDLSMDVECSVFQIETPEGEVFTLPLHEIRSFHALTASLIEQIKASARPEGESDQMPFGFAAFTAMARSQRQQPLEISTIVGPDLDPDQATSASFSSPHIANRR